MRMRAILAAAFIFVGRGSFGQEQPSLPRFEVASVKPSQQKLGKDADSQISISGARLSVKNVTLKGLIVQAYYLQPIQVLGGPNWLDVDEYDVEAKAEVPSSRENFLLMLRALATDRFRLALHKETRELSVYELVADKSGPKIQAVSDADAPTKQSAGLLPSFRGDLQQFANLLSIQLTIPVSDDPGRPGVARGPLIPVVDKTGLTGIYSFRVNMKLEPGADMFTLWQRILREQLGLKLESRKSSQEVLVVDSAEQVPVSN
jgi:uncharacterized protein (TIGR03435 family)